MREWNQGSLIDQITANGGVLGMENALEAVDCALIELVAKRTTCSVVGGCELQGNSGVLRI